MFLSAEWFHFLILDIVLLRLRKVNGKYCEHFSDIT